MEQPRQVLVQQMTVEADGVLSLVLVDPVGAELPAWQPGAHLDLLLADGLVRQYSLCGDPGDRRRYRVAVLREPQSRGGSERVHTVLRPGALVDIKGPRNHFRLEPSPRYLFIAGGIGITPILPMVAAAAASGADWSLLYGGRAAASMAFREGLARHGDRVRMVPEDVHGRLDLDAVLGTPRPDTLVYCCGPESLIAAVEKRCTSWPADALRVERFAAPEEPVRDPADESGVEIVLRRSDRSLRVPAERSILEVLLEGGIDVMNDCQEGICGSCETKVLEGEVDHRDHVLTAKEQASNTCMMVCVSRARSGRLVLDL
ncbi:PDR/VanB family oxidoreductase [Pseudonocardia bannensis]|uniref:Oxidoreductase n=1 Tax=Pseudonocardia bannensis TaxID=630973 RepID=A0A848DNB1_9PSEU|nr:PDR/VanB family oxidoreductase [Pseudonocardia bannensis]NMH94035.1 oxidoreductase [Pseudonocardia bannensis]